MMATLPGIDANDPAKTLACFRLYCNVFSSMGDWTRDDGPLPLGVFMEEWLDEFLVCAL